jgi:hypothetical protein
MALSATGGGGGASAQGVRAGRAYVELGAKDGLSGVLKRVGSRFASFAQQIIALTGVGGILGGIVGGMGVKDTLDDLSKMSDVAKAFGITGKAASGLFGVLGAVGGEFKENLEGVIQFSDTLQQAIGGADGQAAKLFDGLAVSAKELEGLAVDEQFYRVHAAIRDLPQPLQEAKLALLGGTDSMKQWQRLLTMSGDEVRQLAKDMAIGSAELEEAAQASRAMQAAGAAVNRVWQQLVIMLAPYITQLATAVVNALKPVVEWLKGRTLEHLWAEAVARLKLGWEQVKQIGLETWLAVAGFFEDAWYDAEATAKVIFIDLFGWVDKLLSADFWSGLLAGFLTQMAAVGTLFGRMLDDMGKQASALFAQIVNVLTNPANAAAALAALSAGFTPAKQDAAAVAAAVEQAKQDVEQMNEAVGKEGAKVVLGGREAALQAAADKKQEAAARRALQALEGMQGVEAARAALNAELARIERDRAARRGDDEKAAGPALQNKLSAIARSLGTFGGIGSFLTQGFGVQAAEGVGKQMVKEQQRGNAWLSKIAEGINNIPGQLRFQ